MTVAIYQFGGFTVDCGKFELSRSGHRLRLERKPLELLVLLVSRHGQIVTRDEIARRLWEQEVFVDVEHGINTAIRKIRQTLGDSSDLPRFVQTISGSGYRFIATVTSIEPEVDELSQSPGSAPDLAPFSLSEIVLPETGAKPEASVSGIGAMPGVDTHSSDKPGRTRWLVIGLCTFTLLILATPTLKHHSLADRLFHRESRVAIASIAVLPLKNFSGDPGQDYFAEGMTDEMITELAHIPNLRVVSRTSVVAEKGSSLSLPEIGRQLDVDAIVEGSIARAGDRIRITAQLIDARTDRHLWAQSFEGSASNVLSLQDSVAQQIASQASSVLAPTPREPINPAAHDAYLRGRYFFDKQDFTHSLEYFKQAVAIDPNYASAQAGYASALEAATTFGVGAPEKFMPIAVAAARRAIQLDPRNGEAYTALGSVQTIYEWNWNAAEQNLTRGISLNPNDPIAEFKYSTYLDAMGRRQDALAHMRRALQLDPLSFIINLRLGVALYYDRQYDAALAQLKRAAEMEESNGATHWYTSLIYEQMGNRDEAVQNNLLAMQKFRPCYDNTDLLDVYQKRGWMPFWRISTRAFLANKPDSCAAYQIGVNDLRTDQVDHAFESFQKALDGHCFSMAFVRVDPMLDPVRNDPRYNALLERMHP